MSNPFNGSKRGKRGGSDTRPSRKSAFAYELQRETHGTSHTAAVIMPGAILMENTEVSEVIEEPSLACLARRSLTSKLHLRDKRRVATEVIDLAGRQPNRLDPNLESIRVMVPDGIDQFGNVKFKPAIFSVHKMTPVTNPKVLKMSETTLLTKGDPCSDIEDTNIKRETSRTHRIVKDRYDGMISGDSIRHAIRHAKADKEVKR